MLTATTALAAAAFIGTPLASAVTHPWSTWCDSQQLLLCAANNLIKHPLLVRSLDLVGATEFSAGFVTVKCTSGNGETNQVESQQEGAFKATLEKLTFAGCTGCTAFGAKAPQALEVNVESEGTETWRLKATGLKFNLSGCPFGATCTYEGNLSLKVQMDEEGAFADPEGAAFKRVEGSALCAETGKWVSGRTRTDIILDDAKLSIHKRVWPTRLETLVTVNTTKEL